ncbi:hypothetical protein THAOC_14286, partial [Thalassiosira oceanica]
AHYTLGQMYGPGGHLRLDLTRSVEHYEKAAMSGHVMARFSLGVLEYNDGRKHLALQHFLISAKMGHTDSLRNINRLLKKGNDLLSSWADRATARLLDFSPRRNWSTAAARKSLVEVNATRPTKMLNGAVPPRRK